MYYKNIIIIQCKDNYIITELSEVPSNISQAKVCSNWVDIANQILIKHFNYVLK